MTIEKGVKPRQGRSLKCDLTTGAYDWKKYLEPIGVQLMGHTQTHRNFMANLEAVHFFELQLRKNLPAEQKPLVKEMISDKHDNDVILSVKKQISDKAYSQPPFVFVPEPKLKRVSPDSGPGVVPKTTVPKNTAEDLLKTAEKVESSPWNMDKAGRNLRKLAANDFPAIPSCRELPSMKEWKEFLPDAAAIDFIDEADLKFAYRDAAPVSAKPTAAKSKAVSKTSATVPPVPIPAPAAGSIAPPSVANESDGELPSDVGTDMPFP